MVNGTGRRSQLSTEIGRNFVLLRPKTPTEILSPVFAG
jgi:hypothetical protein